MSQRGRHATRGDGRPARKVVCVCVCVCDGRMVVSCDAMHSVLNIRRDGANLDWQAIWHQASFPYRAMSESKRAMLRSALGMGMTVSKGPRFSACNAHADFLTA